MKKTLILVVILVFDIFVLTSCNNVEPKDNYDETPDEILNETPPCYNTDMKITRNPFLDDTQLNVGEMIDKVENIAIIRIDSFIEQSTDIYNNEVSVFNATVFENLKSELESEIVIDGKMKCSYNSELDEYSYTSTYGQGNNPDDYYREGNYYLVLTVTREDSTLYTLYYRELPNYNIYMAMDVQSEHILGVLAPYLDDANSE